MQFEKIKRYDLLGIFIFIICYTIAFSYYTIIRHTHFYTHAVDFGIFDQIFWNMVHNGTQVNTLETAFGKPAVFVNHLGVHFSLILYLFAPLYAIFQTPKTLLILQSFILGFGALPLYLLAKKKTNSIFFSQAICISYLLYPALHNLNLYEFHELAFAPAFILFTLYFLEMGKYKWFLVFLTLSLFIKEDVALSGVFIGLYIAFFKKEKALGIWVAVLSLIYFLATIKIFMPFFGQPYDFTGRFADLISPKYSGYVGIFYTVITHPLFVLQYIFTNPGKLLYIILLFHSVIFLSFFSGSALLLIIPSLFVNLLSSQKLEYSIHVQYTGVVIPFVYFTAVIGYQKLPQKLKKYKHLFCYALIVLAVAATTLTIVKVLNNHKFPLPANYPENTTLIKVIKMVPKDAPIATMMTLAPHFTQRREVWLFPNINDAEYVLFDIAKTQNYWPASYDDTMNLLKKLLRSKQYGVLDFEETYILLKKGYDASANRKTLAAVTK